VIAFPEPPIGADRKLGARERDRDGLDRHVRSELKIAARRSCRCRGASLVAFADGVRLERYLDGHR